MRGPDMSKRSLFFVYRIRKTVKTLISFNKVFTSWKISFSQLVLNPLGVTPKAYFILSCHIKNSSIVLKQVLDEYCWMYQCNYVLSCNIEQSLRIIFKIVTTVTDFVFLKHFYMHILHFYDKNILKNIFSIFDRCLNSIWH